MNSVEYIRKCELNKSLDLEYRQYLTGHLQRKQPNLKHIDDDIEIGISYYKEFTADIPHVHPVATEHGYVLQGCVRMLVENCDVEYQFNEGDFFVIRPGVGHASKNAPNTKVLFIKSPGINDKKTIDVSDTLKQWLSSWE